MTEVGSHALTPRQEAFCQHYVKTGNATQSYFDAGFTAKTRDVAAVCSSQLLAQVKIKHRIYEIRSKVTDKLSVDAAMVLEQYAKIAFADINEFYDITATGMTLKHKIDGTIIQEIVDNSTLNGRTVRVKLSDRMAALQVLAKHFGIIDNKTPDGVGGTPHSDTGGGFDVGFLERIITENPAIVDSVFREPATVETSSSES